MLALCDCNNFFVSCERLCRPDLRGRPVVVLSSNDGCVISRSDEAKAMGIPMGEPFFRIRGLLRNKGVVVRSGNLPMYKEVSSKVMGLLARHTDQMEEYSIDEAFINLDIASAKDPVEYVSEIRRRMSQCVGIPLSIGVAPTKTLSKLASGEAKKSEGGVSRMTKETAKIALDATFVGDVWGIGRKSAEKLTRLGIRTAGDFARKDPLWVKKILTVRGLMTQLELRGQPCLPMAASFAPPKSIQVSRTWGSALESFGDVRGAIMENILKAGRALRKDNMASGKVSVFIRYGYRHGGECGYFTEDAFFGSPAQSDVELISAAMGALGKIYRPGYRYTQGGVILSDFREPRYRQRELFDDGACERRAKYERLSRAVDMINDRLGEMALYPAELAAPDKKWRPRMEYR